MVVSVVHQRTLQLPGGATDDSDPDEPVQLLVALPQSGRTTWLTSRLARARRGAGLSIWLVGEHSKAAPDGVDVVLVRDLVAASATQLAGRTIAIDDLHLLSDEELQDLVGHLEAALAHGATVIATSIAVPSPAITDLGQTRPVRWFGQEDVRVELQAFTQLLASCGLPPRRSRHLHSDLDGWAGPLAAVQTGPPLPPGPLALDILARRAVDQATTDLAPLLADLGPLPPGLSLLPSISRSILVDLLGDEVTDAAMEAVSRFLPPGSTPGEPLRLHPVLRRIIEQVAPVGADAADLRERASAWYLGHDRYADAITVLIEDHRPADALRLIRENQLNLLYYEGRWMQKGLMDRLPRSAWTPDDNLLYVLACLAAGDHRVAAFILNGPALNAPDVALPLAFARDSALNYVGMLGYPPEHGVEAARRALAVLDDLPEDTPLPHLLIADGRRQHRSLLVTHLARNLIVLGEWDEAIETLDAAARSGHALLDYADLAFRAWVHGLRGDADEAQRCAALAMGATDFWPDLHVLAVEPRLALAEIHLLDDRPDLAGELAADALHGGTLRNSAHQMTCALVVLAEVALRTGSPLQARVALSRIDDGSHGFVGQRADAIRVRLLLADDDTAGAEAALRRLPLTQHTIVAHAHGIVAGASPLAAEELEQWEPPPWPSGRQALREAQAVLTPIASGLADQGRAAAGIRPDPARLAAVGALSASRDLSPREAEILVSILTDASLPDVAAALFISRNTLKTHLRRLYRKLGVHSRDEAVSLVARTEHAG